MARKKRINIYLNQRTIDQADELARKLSYELDTAVNRSNVLELAFEILRKQKNVSDLVSEAMLSLSIEQEKEE